jgi:mono/diheme cytochrome c family protein
MLKKTVSLMFAPGSRLMNRHSRIVLALGMILLVIAWASRTPTLFAQDAPAKPNPSGWQIPPDADTLKSPLTVDDKVLAQGKAIFKDKCERCHGPAGLGDGPDADPDAMGDMDLTVAKRAARNPDGVVFHKVMNGRRKPKMPAFKEELTPEQVWAVVAYAQSLRRSK